MRKTLTRFAALLAFTVSFSTTLGAQPWVPAGPDDSNQANYYSTNQVAMGSDRSGGVYVGFAEYVWVSPTSLPLKASVRRWTNGAWQAVGAPGISTGTYRHMQFAVAPGPVPFVVFSDYGLGMKAVVKTFNGTSWTTVGGGPVSAGGVIHTSIALDGSGAPWVAFDDSLNGGKLTVKKWTGTAWQTAGTAGFTPTKPYFVRIVIGSSGIPYLLTLYNIGGTLSGEVFRLSGSAWVSLGSPVSSPARYPYLTEGTDLALSKGDTVYVAYADVASNERVTVRKYTSAGWVTVGSPFISPSASTKVRLHIDTAHGTYLTCVSHPSVGNTTPTYPMIRQFNGTDWVVTGPDSFLSPNSQSVLAFSLDTSGTPHWVYSDPTYSGKLMLNKLTATGWKGLAIGAGFTGGPGKIYSATSPDGKKAYSAILTSVVYNGFPASVYRYDTGWTRIGQSGASGWSGMPLAIAVHPDGNPWIVVRDSANFQMTTVWRYTGSAWVNTLTHDSAGHVSLAFDGAGTAYLAYTPFNSGGMRIKKNDGSGWVSLNGSPVASHRLMSFVRIVPSRAGVPHILTGSWSSAQYAFETFRYTGTAWVSLGGIQNSVVGTSYGGVPDLVFDTSDIPVIAYTNGNGFNVQRYKASNFDWEDILAGSANPQFGMYPRIQYTQDGTLFLSYQDRSTRGTGASTVQRFTGTAWQTIGAPSFTKTFAGEPELMLLNNRILVTFTDGAPYAYKYDCAQPVTITLQPSGLTGCAGGRAAFTTAAAGTTAYQWQINSGKGWLNITNGAAFSGATSNNLSLNAIPTTPDSSMFRCVFTNACGTTVIGEPAMMILAPSLAPTVTVSAIPGTILSPGQTVTFTANVTNGGTTPQYQWLLNGSPISGEISPNYTTNTLVNGDAVTVQITRNDTCAPINTVTSTALTINISLSIGNTRREQALRVVPQPAQSFVTISGYAGMPAGQYRLTLRSITGQSLLEDVITLTGAAWTYPLTIPSSLPAGLYRLTLQGSAHTVSSMLSVVR